MNLQNHGKQSVIVGPWGGQEGQYWDDGVYSTVRQVEITHGAVIDSIRIEYDVNGKSIWSQTHGGSGATKLDKVRLDYPDEFLISISGFYGSTHEHGPVFVRALTFESNKRRYGPFGEEQGTVFGFPKMQGSVRIVGFLGKSGWYLDAIGAYVEPIQNAAVSYPTSVYCPQSPYSPVSYPSSVYYSQYATENSNSQYSAIIQGSLGSNYDLIVAVRPKDDRSTSYNPQHNYHHGYVTAESKNNQLSISSYNQNSGGVVPGNVVENRIERVPSQKLNGVVASGPWGGSGGTTFDDGVYDGVRQINLARSVCIVSIRVCYEQNGHPVWGSKNGGTGAFKTDKIVFDYPSEILTHLTGYLGNTMMMGPSVIKSVTFHTTKGTYGPYGDEEGEFFSTKLKEGSMIVGFHGRKGLFLDAIGVHVLEGKVKNAIHSSTNHASSHNKKGGVSPTSSANASATSSASSSPSNQIVKKADKSEWPFKIGKRGKTDEVVHRTVKNPAPNGPGPWGGEGGKPWDDGVFTGIKQIILTITDAICCVEIEYDRNGDSVWSVKHGGSGGQTANRVKLDYPNEVITCVSGYYGPIKKEQGSKVIQSLTFHSSRRKYGPFGEETGTYFASGTTEGKVVGFHGRSSTYLDAIGVHMQHWSGNNRSSPYKAASSLFKIFS